MSDKTQTPPEQQRVHYVTEDDLPLSCPTPEMTLWSSHPRVYLPIEREGEVTCPYCSAHYILKDKA